jgi:hypothetical protein
MQLMGPRPATALTGATKRQSVLVAEPLLHPSSDLLVAPRRAEAAVVAARLLPEAVAVVAAELPDGRCRTYLEMFRSDQSLDQCCAAARQLSLGSSR